MHFSKNISVILPLEDVAFDIIVFEGSVEDCELEDAVDNIIDGDGNDWEDEVGSIKIM